MAGLRTASDERLFMGGIVIAVWLAGLAVVGLLFPLGQRSSTAPAPAPAPPLTPVETLPPIIVVAGRADVYAPDCRAGERNPADRHCAASTTPHGDDPFATAPAAPAAAPRRGPLP